MGRTPPARSCDTLQSEANGVAVVGHLGISNGRRTMDGRTDGQRSGRVSGGMALSPPLESVLARSYCHPLTPVYDALQSLTVKLVDEFPADHCGL